MFAIITPALITGAFANRMTFKAYVIFLVAWQLLVYYPFVHMVWGGEWMAEYGVLDSAGFHLPKNAFGGATLALVRSRHTLFRQRHVELDRGQLLG